MASAQPYTSVTLLYFEFNMVILFDSVVQICLQKRTLTTATVTTTVPTLQNSVLILLHSVAHRARHK
jgi:hypothetical protein